MNEAQLVRAPELGDLISTLKACAAATHDRDALLQLAFEGIGPLPIARVLRLREDAGREVAAERAALAARRASRIAE